MPKRACIFTLLLLLASSSFAVQHDFTPFLRWGVGARPMGMGKAFSFLADDPNTVYYNPAGLGFQKGMQIEGQLNQEFYRVANNYFGITKDNWGIGYQTYGKYTIPYWKIDDTYDEFETTDCSLLMLAYARKLSPSLSVGGSLKSFIIDANKGYVRGKSLDLGLLYKPSPLWQFGLAAQDLISFIDDFRAYKTNADDGPLSKTDVLLYPNIKLGLANFNNYFNFTAELINIGYNEQLHWGFEKKPLPFVFDSQLALRGGAYGSLPTYINSSHKLNKSIGISFYKGWFELDYALEFYPDGGTSARSSGIIRGEGLAGIFPFLVPLLGSTPQTTPPPPLLPRGLRDLDQTRSDQNGNLLINIVYSPVPISDKHGAASAEVTLVKLQDQAPADSTLRFPDKGLRPAFMKPSNTDPRTYSPPQGKTYRNIPINRYFASDVRPPANTIEHLPAGRYLLQVAAEHSVPCYDEIEISANQTTQLTATLEPAYGGLNGTVIDGSGGSTPQGTVQVIGAERHTLSISPAGRFSINNLPSGFYRLLIQATHPHAFISREVNVEVPGAYTSQNIGEISLTRYIATGNIIGRIEPLQALNGYLPGTLNPVSATIFTTSGRSAWIDYQTGNYIINNLQSGPHQMEVGTVAGWLSPGLISIRVPDLGRTVEAVITLESDANYLADIQLENIYLLQREMYANNWQTRRPPANSTEASNFISLVSSNYNHYKLTMNIKNYGPAAAQTFGIKVIHQISYRHSTNVQERVLVHQAIENIYPAHNSLNRLYHIDLGPINWENNAINKIIIQADPDHYIPELNDENNGEVLVYEIGSSFRDARFPLPPTLSSIKTWHTNAHPRSPSAYLAEGNNASLSPGDRLRFQTEVSGIVSGDELAVYLYNDRVARTEIYRAPVPRADNNFTVEIPLNQPGRWWLSFELDTSKATLEADPNLLNNRIEAGPFLVLMSDEIDFGYFKSDTENHPRYTEDPITAAIDFRNESAGTSEGDFINYKVEVQTADNILLLLTQEAFPKLDPGKHTKQIAIPPGALFQGDNVLKVSFMDRSSPANIIKCFTKIIPIALNPIYTTDTAIDGKKVLWGVDTPLQYLDMRTIWYQGESGAAPELYERRFSLNNRTYGMGLAAVANQNWGGQTSKIEGYLYKSFYLDTPSGRLYTSQFPETVAKRKKDHVTLIYPVLFAGAIDSGLFQVFFLYGMDHYAARIRTGFVNRELSGLQPQDEFLRNIGAATTSNSLSLLNCERGYPYLESALAAVDWITLGFGVPLESTFATELTGKVSAKYIPFLAKLFSELMNNIPGWELNAVLATNDALNVKEAPQRCGTTTFKDILDIHSNQRYYSFYTRAEISATSLGVAWAVNDFHGIYTKKGLESIFDSYPRGILMPGAYLHFWNDDELQNQ